MKTYAQKMLVAMTVVIGMTIGAGTMPAAAGPQSTNTLERGDSGGPTSVVAGVATGPAVHQGRYRIGFQP